MTALAGFFDGPFFDALGWALFHFLWQGALVAALAASLGFALRLGSAAARYALACGALALMLALPAATAWRLLRAGAPGGGSSEAQLGRDLPAALVSRSPSAAVPPDAVSTRGVLLGSLQQRIETLRPWALSIWIAGVLLLSVRFLGGLRVARRLTRRGAKPAPGEWQETVTRLARRLSVARPVRLLESALVSVPTAVGVLRPAILLPASVFTGLPCRGLEALLVHELAHIRRHDYLVNLLQALAETLLFYHPAVWWVSDWIRAERESCCDDLAVAATGDVRAYARALVSLEEMRGPARRFAVAASGGQLRTRVARLFRAPAAERASGWLAGAIALAMLFTLGAASRIGPTRLSGAGASSSRGSPAPDAVVVAGSGASGSPRPDCDEDERDADGSAAAEDGGSADPDFDPGEAVVSDPDPDEPAAGGEGSGASGLLTPEQLIAFRTHGVTAEFVRELAALGYDRADPDDVLALKVHGARPEEIAALNGVFGRLPLDDHVAFKIHGVTPESVARLASLGFGKLSADDVLALAIHGVDREFLDRLRGAGFTGLSPDDAVSAKIHGVDPTDASVWEKLGCGRPPLEDLTSIRIHGVTSEFIREVRSLGYTEATADDLVSLSVHGIGAKTIRKENARAGRRLSFEDLVDRGAGRTKEEDDGK